MIMIIDSGDNRIQIKEGENNHFGADQSIAGTGGDYPDGTGAAAPCHALQRERMGAGISVPSAQLLVELAETFSISTDYLLGVERTASVGVEGLTQKDVELVKHLISCLREKNQEHKEY